VRYTYIFILQQIDQSGDEMDRDQSTSRTVQVTAVVYYYMRTGGGRGGEVDQKYAKPYKQI
jgi:hypothetical protein